MKIGEKVKKYNCEISRYEPGYQVIHAFNETSINACDFPSALRAAELLNLEYLVHHYIIMRKIK